MMYRKITILTLPNQPTFLVEETLDATTISKLVKARFPVHEDELPHDWVGSRELFPEPDVPPCPGCGRKELHKMCPAYGTEYYMSGRLFTQEIEAELKSK